MVPHVPDDGNDLKRRAAIQLVAFGALAECALGLVALFGGWLFGIPIRDYVQWSLEAVGKGVVATLPMLLLLCLVEWAPGKIFQNFRRLVDGVIRPFVREVNTGELAVLAVAAGLGEEVFFRGLVQGGLLRVLPLDGLIVGMPWEGPLLAIVLASILFGLAHPLSSFYVVLTTAMGIYLGILFYWGENLLVPIVAHAVYDFIALVYLARYRHSKSASEL